MADFESFHGLRYNTEKVDLAAVLAPPYDVIKGAMRAELAARSEYNVVSVELPEGEGDSKYENAARLLKAWQEQNILLRDDASFYVYEQEFGVPGSASVAQRRGVLGALRLEEFGEGVKPHEHTLSGPKEDRLKLLRATHTNTSPIFGLYADDDGWVGSLLDVVCSGEPLAQAKDADGIVHRMWRVTDDETVNAIVAALENEDILIADGHHRYETALNYRNERRADVEASGAEWAGSEPVNYVLMMCVSTSDPGLIVLPTHRLVKADNDQASRLPEALEQHFEVEELLHENNPDWQAEALLRRLNEHVPVVNTPRLGMRLQGRSYLLRLRPGDAYLTDMDAGRSEAYNRLDVTLLHTLIMERQLGIGPTELAAGGHVSYTIDAEEAFKKVDAGDYGAAFLLRPTPVEQVQEVAAAGDKMPQKSTYFYPKLVTGLVLRPLD
jgi:uncharacterized protein (DUF1015 family)